MKKTILLVLALAGMSSLIYADAESEALTNRYNDAVAKAIAPIQKTYEIELRKLLDKHSRLKNADAIVEIQAKLELLKASVKVKPESDVLKEFAGKKLINPSGQVVFEFNDVGKGVKLAYGQKIPFTWKVEGEVVHYNGPRSVGSAPEDLYFKFTGRTEAICGSTLDTMTFPFKVTK